MQKDTPPVVPVGFTTQLGISAVAAQWLVALVLALVHGDHSDATLTALITGAVTLFTVLAGRYAQATKATSPQPTPQAVDATSASGELEGPPPLNVPAEIPDGEPAS